PVVRFTQTSSQVFNLADVMNGASAGDLFAVIRASGINDGKERALWSFGVAGGAFFTGSNGNIYEDFGTNTRPPVGIPLAPANTATLYNVTGTSTQWSIRLNGATFTSRNSNSVSFSSTPMVGSANGYYADGDIAEIIVYNRALSAAEREAVERYLAVKYALPNIVVPGTPTAMN